jgi:hypothetical protein
MASTRNNNTPGNYACQQRSILESRDYLTYMNSANGYAFQSCLPGDGLLAGQVPYHMLSRNAADIESSLWGVGSTNLVNPAPCLVPEIKELPSANIYEKPAAIFMPEPLVVKSHQRPFPVPLLKK